MFMDEVKTAKQGNKKQQSEAGRRLQSGLFVQEQMVRVSQGDHQDQEEDGELPGEEGPALQQVHQLAQL